MAKLVVNPASPHPWEIQLKPGTNLLGRGFANDFKIDDPSVSGSHCQIVVDLGGVLIKDLGSTNGTFVNRAPVHEAALQPGQTVHLGGVEMVFQAESAEASPLAMPPPPSMPSSGVRMNSPPVRIVPTAMPAAAAPPPAEALLPPPLPPAPGPAAGDKLTAAHYCKFHPKAPARFLCHKCNRYFCELCVTTRGQHKTCRHCGSECTPIKVQLQRAAEKGFFARIPEAFVYPFRGAGVVVVVVGIVILTMLKFSTYMMRLGSMRSFIFGVILLLCAGGYLFTFLQSILHSTAAEDRELPDLPSIANFADDVLMPFFRLLGLTILCFGPGLALGIWVLMLKLGGSAVPVGLPIAFLVTLGFGFFYFPMAFLAVAILDSVMAANPLLVVPSILKTIIYYLSTLVVMAAPWTFRALADIGLKLLFPDGWTTHDMGQLFLMIGCQLFAAFTTLYLLIVGVRVLGHLYVTRRTTLNWLARG